MTVQSGAWAPPCPVCGRPVGDIGAGPCPACGLPAAGQAAVVVARIGATLTELARDRDALVATLRATAPGAPSPSAPPVAAPAASPGTPPVPPPPGHPAAPPAPPPPAFPAATPPPPGRTAPRFAPPRRVSPQGVLLGLGALLLVAAAITFVAVAWSRFGLVFQAGVMLTATAALCASSAWTARRGLRATEEALAAAGAALLAVDLGAARGLGLFRLEDVALRSWWAISCAVVVVVALALARGTRSTATWPLAALLAAQPLPFLLLSPDQLTGPAGVAVALALAAADLSIARRIRPVLVPVARVLAAVLAVVGVVGGLTTAAGSDAGDSWTATGVLLVAGVAALVVDRRTGSRLLPGPDLAVPGLVGAVAGLAVALSLRTAAEPGWWAATALGLALVTAAVLLAGRRRTAAGLLVAGQALVGVPVVFDGADRLAATALVFLAGTVPAVLAAVRLPRFRSPATSTAMSLPWFAVLLAWADGVLAAPVAGLLLAVLAAVVFTAATARAGRPEEVLLAVGGAVAGLTACGVTGSVGAWGQVSIQLAVAAVAAGSYALVAGRRPVAVAAVAALVVAVWIAVGGAGVESTEAYTLPAALGLLAIAVPRLRAGAPSWAAEGPAVGVALVPSALVVVAEPTALRLVLVVAAAALLTVAGALQHRQAPFVIGAASLLLVTVARLAPYAPLLPRWLTLGSAGLLLLVVGATYERRRQQAREAVGWVGQMR